MLFSRDDATFQRIEMDADAIAPCDGGSQAEASPDSGGAASRKEIVGRAAATECASNSTRRRWAEGRRRTVRTLAKSLCAIRATIGSKPGRVGKVDLRNDRAGRPACQPAKFSGLRSEIGDTIACLSAAATAILSIAIRRRCSAMCSTVSSQSRTHTRITASRSRRATTATAGLSTSRRRRRCARQESAPPVPAA